MSGYKTPPLKACPVARGKQPTPAPALARLEGHPTVRKNLNLSLEKQAEKEKTVNSCATNQNATAVQNPDDDLMALANVVLAHQKDWESTQRYSYPFQKPVPIKFNDKTEKQKQKSEFDNTTRSLVTFLQLVHLSERIVTCVFRHLSEFL